VPDTHRINFLYYKKYVPKAGQIVRRRTAKLYNAFTRDDEEKAKVTKPKIEQKTLSNPLLKVPEEKKTCTEAQLGKDDLPGNRTIIAVNFDREFDVGDLKKWFGACGKVRAAYTASHKVKTDASSSKPVNRIFIGLIVFKYEQEMMKCFETTYFQMTINKLYFHNIHKKKPGDSVEKDEYAINLIDQYEVRYPLLIGA
jgi:hypothetical protein